MQKKRGSIIRPWGRGNLAAAITAKNYCARVKAAYPTAAEYLARLGVEIEKPLETSPLEPGADGMMEVCKARFYPETGVKEEHFVLELSPIRLKGWQE